MAEKERKEGSAPTVRASTFLNLVGKEAEDPTSIGASILLGWDPYTLFELNFLYPYIWILFYFL